jgi:zinc transport system ATP-binding protein
MRRMLAPMMLASMTGPSLIEARHIGLRARKAVILEDVSLTVAPGERLTVIGPNGGGKTVLLTILMGLMKPGQGQVIRKSDLKIGYMPQRFAPEPSLPITVARFLGLARNTTPARIENALHQAKAEAFADKPLHVLSGGELQRVLLARALLHDPDILVLDEPVQNLDYGGAALFYSLIQSLHRERGCAILMVTHDLPVALDGGGRMILLKQRVLCDGAPKDVMRDPSFMALFGGGFHERAA